MTKTRRAARRQLSFNGVWVKNGVGPDADWTLEHPDDPEIVYARIHADGEHGYSAYLMRDFKRKYMMLEQFFTCNMRTLRDTQHLVEDELRRRWQVLCALFDADSHIDK